MITRTLALVALTTWFALSSPTEAQAKQDYCASGGGTVLMLLDRTTAYDDRDLEVLTNGLDAIFKELQVGDRLVVHTITGDYTASSRAFDQCVPGCPEGGLGEWLWGTCKAAVAKADNRTFRINLAQVLRGMLTDKQAHEYSDIARTIDETSRAYADKRLKRLIVFSDMLENSTAMPWETLRKAKPETAAGKMRADGIQPHLAGAGVDVFGFGRNHDPGRKALDKGLEKRLKEFWGAYFRSGNAGPVTMGLWYVGGGARPGS